ncbi:hypothetical protein BGZ49_003203, partial [Haplosporangium sp. Z 27]
MERSRKHVVHHWHLLATKLPGQQPKIGHYLILPIGVWIASSVSNGQIQSESLDKWLLFQHLNGREDI